MTSSNVYLLEQALHLLEQIDDGLYTGLPHGITKSGVGGHVRHCLDFYHSFLSGIGAGRIDYDRRERDELIEQDRGAARAKVAAMIRQLQSLPVTEEQARVLVKLEGGEAQDALAWSGSTVSRELQFLLSHTVHHYALIAMLLRLQGFEPPPYFGVAPSTLKYWQAQA